jgi:hypothetical protein
MRAGQAAAEGYIGRWRPSSVSPQAAGFARDVISLAGPLERERAKNLLWAAGKLADYATGLGLEAVPEVLLHPSVAERFTRCAPGLSGVARRTLRTNLRFLGRRVVPQLYPADLPLPRERSKAPYSPAQISGYLALADAQPAMERRMRAAGLVCLGAGAGLIRGDLRDVRGVPASSPCHAASSESCCSLTNATSAWLLSSTRPAANSTAERGSSTNMTWISRQRVVSLAVALAAGDSGIDSGSASGTEKVMDLSASPWPTLSGSSPGPTIAVAPGCQVATGTTG